MAEGPLLSIQNLTAGYGAATILHEVGFEMGIEAVAIVGRNGMGKTTLCNTVMGLVPARSGSVTLHGQELVGNKIHRIAQKGIGYVPQGRRLFPSLTVDEHLSMLAKGTSGKRWTPQSVYELFPRLKERTKVSGTSLSGGEQQMLAIGRALLLNADLIIMDEPSEGLAPTVVENLIEVCGGACRRRPRRSSGGTEPPCGDPNRRSPIDNGVRAYRSRVDLTAVG